MMRRAYALSLLTLGLGGLGLMVAFSNTWLLVTSPLLGGGTQAAQAIGVQVTPVSGSALSPAGGVMGLLTLVLGGAVILSRGTFRRVAGVLCVVTSLIGAGTAATFAFAGGVPDWLAADIGTIIGYERTSWWLLALAAGLIAAAGGVLVAVRGGQFAAFSNRYERSAAHPRSAWEALDRGIDPTDDAPGRT